MKTVAARGPDGGTKEYPSAGGCSGRAEPLTAQRPAGPPPPQPTHPYTSQSCRPESGR